MLVGSLVSHLFFFFSSRRRHTRLVSDWSSDVCSSDMNRRGLKIPLLIGGATTSKRHTAVKIAPSYQHETIHVIDASRAVPVVGALMRPESRQALDAQNRKEQDEIRVQFENRAGTQLLTYEEAIRHKLHTEWDDHHIAVPEFTGRHVLKDFSLAELVPYIY